MTTPLMCVQCVVINGCGNSGKDTFVKYCTENANEHGDIECYNYSTIDTVRDIMGVVDKYYHVCGEKDDTMRSCMSDIKRKLEDHMDYQLSDFIGFINRVGRNGLIDRIRLEFGKSKSLCDCKHVVIFVHIREPNRIAAFSSAVDWLSDKLNNKGYRDNTVRYVPPYATVLIDGRTSPDEFTNESDRRVCEYDYTFTISNDSTLGALKEKADKFMDIIRYGIDLSVMALNVGRELEQVQNNCY